MTSHKDHRLDMLGIPSQDEADELERELDIRFDQFSYHDRKVWNQQNSYLDEYARTRTVSYAADTAGVTVSTAQAWKYLVTLGFTRRLEVADLRFSDRLQVMALERAREPDAPASLLIALLRAHIPEKYSANGHLLDTSKSDELLFHYRQDAQRELAAGHPTLRAIANGTYQPPQDSPSHTNLSSAEGDTAHPNLSPDRRDTAHPNLSPDRRDTAHPDLSPDRRDTAHPDLSPDRRDTAHPDLSPDRRDTAHPNLSPDEGENTTTFDLSPGGGETQRGGFSPTTQYVAEETTSQDDYPPLDPDEFAHFDLSPAGGDTSHPHLSPTEGDTAHPHLSPGGGETQRGGSPSASPAPSAVNRPTHPIASLYRTARRHPNNDHNTFKVTRF